MYKLEDMTIKDGNVLGPCAYGCDNCPLGANRGMKESARRLIKKEWPIPNGRTCGEVLQAWRDGKIAYIDNKWYEVSP